MSTEVLSRIQFALTLSFHFLFPPMSIGLGLILIVMQGLRLWRGKQLYVDMARFWTRRPEHIQQCLDAKNARVHVCRGDHRSTDRAELYGHGVLHLPRQGGAYGRVLLSGLLRITVKSQVGMSARSSGTTYL